jgi:hypothetical protein
MESLGLLEVLDEYRVGDSNVGQTLLSTTSVF